MSVHDMSAYERGAWDEVVRWRTKRMRPAALRLLPKGARDRLTRTSRAAKEKFDALPGSQQFVELFSNALEGLLGVVSRTAEASVRREAVVAAYAKRGHVVIDIDDIRKLDLRYIDKVKPHLELYYTLASTVEGGGAALVISGGEIAAGATGAPGAGTVVAVMAADAVAVMAAMTRAIGHTAAYYGYDSELPGERVFALGVLSFGVAQQAGKAAAYFELNKLVQNLARNATWAQLDRNAVTQVVKVVYQRVGERITKQKLGQTVPVVGVAFGAGLNARYLAKVTTDANWLYRERFLREKYDLPVPPTGVALNSDGSDFDEDPATAVSLSVGSDGNIQIVELVEQALDVDDEETDDGPESA